MSLTLADWLQQHAKDLGVTYMPLRECSICNTEIGYEIIDDCPYFNPSCSCSVTTSPLEPTSWKEMANLIGRQGSNLVKQQLITTLFSRANPGLKNSGKLPLRALVESLVELTHRLLTEVELLDVGGGKDPVHLEDGQWYFWVETWGDRLGPFATEAEARLHLDLYVALNLGRRDDD
jgi:hypothetical protein